MIGLWVVLAGGAGASARFAVDGAVRQRWSKAFPLATVLINVSGSLLLGWLVGLVLYDGGSTTSRLVLGTGFCGGYTTFSTASFETLRLLQQRRHLLALAYAGGTAALTLLAAGAGLGLAQL